MKKPWVLIQVGQLPFTDESTCIHILRTGPVVIKLFSCSAQLKLHLLMKTKFVER